MNIDAKVKYSTEGYSWLCFSCAVKFSLAGYEIETTIDDYDSDYYMGQTWCDHPEPTPKIKEVV